MTNDSAGPAKYGDKAVLLLPRQAMLALAVTILLHPDYMLD